MEGPPLHGLHAQSEAPGSPSLSSPLPGNLLHSFAVVEVGSRSALDGRRYEEMIAIANDRVRASEHQTNLLGQRRVGSKLKP
eukprot:724308-Amphidinium_carterae.1